MSVQELSSIGGIVAAVAVLFTLVYLCLKTRQSRLAAEENVQYAGLQATHSMVWLPLVLILVAAIVPGKGSAAEKRAVASAERQVLKVGPGQRYTRPSQAARAARDGALVEFYSRHSAPQLT